MDKRPFRILGLHQVAIGNLDLQNTEKLWVDLLGLQETSSFRLETENVEGKKLNLGDGDFSVEVELMKPLDPKKKPMVHKPALNHIGLWIDSLEDAVQYLEKRGVRFAPGGIRQGPSGSNVAFIHPKGNDEFPLGGEGVLIELVQAPKAMLEKVRPQG